MSTTNTNPMVIFKQTLTELIVTGEFALPSNVKPDAFKNAAVVAAQDNPKIMLCDQSSVFKSLRTLAAAGLVPDGREAALVPFKTKVGNDWIDKCQAMPMVFGLIKMVRRSGEVSDIRAHIVYQNEVDQGRFEYVVGDEESLRHEPILFGEKGAPVAVYAIAKLKDGGIVREFLTAQEVETIRRSSSAQKVFVKGARPEVSKEPIGIWKDWWAEMWKKSAIRRICKRLDMSSEDMRRLMVDEDTESKDITPAGPSAMQRKIAAGLAAKAEAEADMGNPTSNIEDAEELPDEPTADHWTVDFDTSEAFPGDDDWDEGMKAFSASMKRSMCPHEDDPKAAANWLGGYDGARKAAT